jgi:prepilin-type N-terminal cleavage/methylation domain-containing protein
LNFCYYFAVFPRRISVVQKEPHACRAVGRRGDRRRAFTLLEMLIVMGIISVLLVALTPAVTSLSKSNGRRAAVSALLGAIEQARAEAIKSGQATYVVFPIFTNGTESTLDRYNYKSYAIFEDDAANPGSVKQLTSWNPLPAGVALRSGGTAALSNLADPGYLSPVPTFRFTPDANAAPTYRCLKFNLNGEIEAPIAPPANVLFAVFEGYVSNGNEVITGGNDGSGNPLAAEYLMISRMTGRAEPTAAPTP